MVLHSYINHISFSIMHIISKTSLKESYHNPPESITLYQAKSILKLWGHDTGHGHLTRWTKEDHLSLSNNHGSNGGGRGLNGKGKKGKARSIYGPSCDSLSTGT